MLGLRPAPTRDKPMARRAFLRAGLHRRRTRALIGLSERTSGGLRAARVDVGPTSSRHRAKPTSLSPPPHPRVRTPLLARFPPSPLRMHLISLRSPYRHSARGPRFCYLTGGTAGVRAQHERKETSRATSAPRGRPSRSRRQTLRAKILPVFAERRATQKPVRSAGSGAAPSQGKARDLDIVPPPPRR